MQEIRSAIFETLQFDHPQTVRGVFYQLTVMGVVPKTDNARGYGTVQRLIAEMRREDELPFHWIADATRWMRKPTTYDSLESALRITAETYRRSLWAEGDTYVEIWLEKEALAGVLVDVTNEFDVPLMVTRGYPSLTFVQSAAEAISAQNKFTHIYYFGDHDPSGVDISRKLEEDLRKFTGKNQIFGVLDEVFGLNLAPDMVEFDRVAVTPDQIFDWDLPTRPTKKTDTRSKNFTGESVELDAISSERLRSLARECIERHVDHHALGVLQKTEDEERRVLERIAGSLNGGAA